MTEECQYLLVSWNDYFVNRCEFLDEILDLRVCRLVRHVHQINASLKQASFLMRLLVILIEVKFDTAHLSIDCLVIKP